MSISDHQQLATMFMSTLIFIFYMFLIAMFIIYFGYMSIIVSLLLSSCICSYSAHPNMQDPWVGGCRYGTHRVPQWYDYESWP
jgi:hypothetical protein